MSGTLATRKLVNAVLYHLVDTDDIYLCWGLTYYYPDINKKKYEILAIFYSEEEQNLWFDTTIPFWMSGTIVPRILLEAELENHQYLDDYCLCWILKYYYPDLNEIRIEVLPISLTEMI